MIESKIHWNKLTIRKVCSNGQKIYSLSQICVCSSIHHRRTLVKSAGGGGQSRSSHTTTLSSSFYHRAHHIHFIPEIELNNYFNNQKNRLRPAEVRAVRRTRISDRTGASFGVRRAATGQYLTVWAWSPFWPQMGHVYARRMGHVTVPWASFR